MALKPFLKIWKANLIENNSIWGKHATSNWWVRHIVLNTRTWVTSCGTKRHIFKFVPWMYRMIEVAVKFCLFSDWKSDWETFWEQRTPHPRPTARRHPGWRQRWRIHSPADRWLFPTGARIPRASGSTHQRRLVKLILSYNTLLPLKNVKLHPTPQGVCLAHPCLKKLWALRETYWCIAK